MGGAAPGASDSHGCTGACLASHSRTSRLVSAYVRRKCHPFNTAQGLLDNTELLVKTCESVFGLTHILRVLIIN